MQITLTSKQKQFIRESNEVWNFKIGAVRSGKSYEDIAFEIINGIRERTGLDGLNVIMGVSKTTIERNVLKPMREIYTSALVSTINSQNICYIAGEEVYCVGAEKQSQVSKIQGSSIKYCYGDEVAKWNVEVFTMLESRLDKPYSRFSGSANPEHPQHWLKQFLDNDEFDKYIQHYTIYDNPYLPKSYVTRLEKMYAGTVYFNRYILGEWKRAEGSCCPLIADNQEQFMVNRDDVPKLLNYSFGVDWGGNKSKHAFVVTGFTRDWEVYVLKALPIDPDRMTYEELAQMFLKFVSDIKSDYKFTYAIARCDSADVPAVTTFENACLTNRNGVQVCNAKKTEINGRIGLVNSLANTNRIHFVRGETETLVTALAESVYDEKSFENKRLDNGTTKNYDLIDAFEYTIEEHSEIILDRIQRGVKR